MYCALQERSSREIESEARRQQEIARHRLYLSTVERQTKKLGKQQQAAAEAGAQRDGRPPKKAHRNGDWQAVVS